MPQTPADELRAAATELRKLVVAVPRERWGDRPWHVEECSSEENGDCPCIVAQGESKPFDQPQRPLIQYVADVETPEHAHYIAAMHPGVGAALANWLDGTAVAVDARSIMPGSVLYLYALAVARAINGPAPVFLPPHGDDGTQP